MPSWLQLLESVPDSIGEAFTPGFLRRAAQVFAANGDTKNAESLVPIIRSLMQVEVTETDLLDAVASLGIDPSLSFDFNTFAALLLRIMASLEQLESATFMPPAEHSASMVVWELARRSLPMLIRKETIRSPQLGVAPLGLAGTRAQKRQEADIDLRTGVAEFEQRLKGDTPFPSNWTDEMGRLEKCHRDFPGKVWSQREVAGLFQTLRVASCGVTVLDKGLLDMTGVTALDVSGNTLRRVDWLPPALVGLTLNGNTRSLDADVFDATLPAPTLRVLSLSYDGLGSVPAGLSPRTFPGLCALDLTGNALCDIEAAVAAFSALPNLEHLALAANPLALLPSYRDRVLFVLPDLLTLDDASNEAAPQDTPPAVPVVLIRITVQGVSGLPYSPEDSAATGVIRVRLWDTSGETIELPWTPALVSESAVTTAEDDVPAKGKVADKKKPLAKGAVEEPHVAVVPSSPPQVIELRVSPSAGLRDTVCLSGIEVAVLRLSKGGAPKLVTQAAIPCGAFLEPAFVARGSCVVHERAALAGVPASEVRVMLELNPEDWVASLLQGP